MPSRAFQPKELAAPHGGLTLRVPFYFQHFGLTLTLADPRGWHAIAAVYNILAFELEHGQELERVAYNRRCIAQTAKSKRPLLSHHADLWDLFVPIVDQGSVRQILISGPFFRSAPTAEELVARWRALTGRTAHLNDPEFSQYLTAALSTALLEDRHVAWLEEALCRTAEVVVGRGDPAEHHARFQAIATGMAETTLAARCWDAARTMVDASTASTWSSPLLVDQLAEVGLREVPQHALVGLVASRTSDADPIDELVRVDALQRACVQLAFGFGGALAGRVGGHGVVFLLAMPGARSRARSRLLELAARATPIARRLGFRLHFGVDATRKPDSLVASYHVALAAAEEALSHGASFVESSGRPARSVHALAALRREFARPDDARPLELTARFARYIELVGAHTGYQFDAARRELEAGFERLVAPFVERGLLDAHTLDALDERRDRAASVARTLNELFVSYRRAVAELQGSLQKPTETRHDNDLGRALAYVEAHLGGSLRRSDVARAAGFAPDYFSRLFKKREHITFERYLQRRRVERAKRLLAQTGASLEAVGRLCGFGSGPYFHRVFRAVTGVTPGAFREDARSRLPASRSRTHSNKARRRPKAEAGPSARRS